MGFWCPQCSGVDSLAITASLSLPADSRSDEIALQVVECGACGFSGLAVYEESRRGSLEAESWDHTGYRAVLEMVAATRSAIESCPDPGKPDCPCLAHRAFGLVDAQGRWQGPEGLFQAESFPLRRPAEEG